MNWADLVAEVVAFLIVVWFVVRYLVPFFRKATDERQRVIHEQLEASRADKAAAEKAEAEFNRAHDGLAAELQERARTDSARILNRGQEQLAAERETAVRQIRSDAGRLAVELAEQVVLEFLRDAGRRRASVGRALDGITAGTAGATRPREAALAPASTGEGSL